MSPSPTPIPPELPPTPGQDDPSSPATAPEQPLPDGSKHTPAHPFLPEDEDADPVGRHAASALTNDTKESRDGR
jgi:hypothetical protein